MKKTTLRILLVTALVTLNIGVDQYSKIILREKVEYYSYKELLGKFLTMTKVENKGAFLSLGSELGPVVKDILLLYLPAAALLAGLIYLLASKKMKFWTLFALSFIVGGGIANIYDRMVYGSVTDFFQMNFGFARTGIFNLADVSIMIGFGILVILNSTDKKKEGKEEARIQS